MVDPKHTDHEFNRTVPVPQSQLPQLAAYELFRATRAGTYWLYLPLFRTITAPCTLAPLGDLIAHTCATRLVPTLSLPSQRQVLELEVIGFVLPYRTHVPVAAAAGVAVARLSPSATEATATAAAAFFFHSMAETPRVKGK
ncbi:hypothetical protein ADL05_17940 [Nocardiopsis sp. NRRL B-16309]|nr:hypothetical protein ADL05_17940 [Nocardiopsis sp. NRRL B-16309]